MIPCGSNNLACSSIIVANQLNLGMGMILPATDGKTITQLFYRNLTFTGIGIMRVDYFGD